MHCKKCNATKPENDFYVSSPTKCKECVKASVRANRAENLAYYQEFDRGRAMEPHRVAARAAYSKTDAYAQSHEAANKRWAAKHPDRRTASHIVGNAVRDGRLVPWPVCALPECEGNPQGHHADYSRPLDVVWLCPKHHRQAHSLLDCHARP